MPIDVPSPPVITDAGSLVAEVLADSQSMASQAVARGLSALQGLSGFALAIPEVVAPSFEVPVIDVPAAGTAPQDPGNLSVTLPAVPTEPTAGDIGSLDVGEAPAYTLTAPLLVDVPLPDPLDALLPVSPALDVVATPVEPDFTLPAVPTFTALNLPGAPVFDVPLFTDAEPVAPTAPGEAQLTWAEVAYQSDLLADLNNRLLGFIQGTPSALAPEVEAAIVQKALDAQAQQTVGASDEAMNQLAARGFTAGGGQAVRAVQKVLDEALTKASEASRQTMIEQARLEQANFHFAFTKAMQLEGQLVALFNNVQQRALEAAKFRVEAVIQLFNARVQLYQADAQAFAAKADAFKTRLQAALAQLEVYKAELQGAALVGQLNVQLASQYKAQVEGVTALAEVFKARVQAVTLAVETNKNRTELYRAQIQGYAAQAKASESLAKTALAQVQGEQAKAELFAAEVAGYGSRVEAYRVLTDARLSEATLLFQQVQQFPVELYKGRIEGYQALISAEAERLKTEADVFTSRVEGYAATERSNAQTVIAQAQVAATTTRLYASRAQLAVNAATVNAKTSQVRAETAQSGLRAGAQIMAQLASAAMAARNISASISGSVSNSAAMSVSNNNSFSSSNSTSLSSSNSTNRSSTNSTSMGGGVTITDSFTMSDNQTSSDTITQSVTNSISQSTSNDTRREARNITARSMNDRDSFATETIFLHRE
jgi:hypothetical protein